MADFRRHCLLLPWLLFLSLHLNGQKPVKPETFDSLKESHIRNIKVLGVADTVRASVRVLVFETGKVQEPIQGATVLLRRDNDKMLGRVTKQDGSCKFMPVPATYSVRVQLTGYKNLEAAGLVFEPGKIYELELRLARN